MILTFTDKGTGLLKHITATTSVYITFKFVFGFIWYNKTGIWLFLLRYGVSGNMSGIMDYSSIIILAANSQDNNTVSKPVSILNVFRTTHFHYTSARILRRGQSIREFQTALFAVT